MAGLSRYQNIYNEDFSFNTLNWGIGDYKFPNVWWRADNLLTLKNIKNIVILRGTNNLRLDVPEDIADGIMEI